MKKFLFSLAALLLLVSGTQSANAQDLYARRISIGPVFTAGMSIATGDVPEGYKIKPRFGFQVGAFSEFDVSNLVSIDLGLTYLNRNRYFYQENDDDFNGTIEANYLAITPMASFKGFLLGFGINIPMSGTLITKVPGQEFNTDYTDNMNTVVDFKIGGNIPLLKTEGGELNLLVIGAYDLGSPFKDPNKDQDDVLGPDAGLQLGLTYLFNVSTLK